MRIAGGFIACSRSLEQCAQFSVHCPPIRVRTQRQLFDCEMPVPVRVSEQPIVRRAVYAPDRFGLNFMLIRERVSNVLVVFMCTVQPPLLPVATTILS